MTIPASSQITTEPTAFTKPTPKTQYFEEPQEVRHENSPGQYSYSIETIVACEIGCRSTCSYVGLLYQLFLRGSEMKPMAEGLRGVYLLIEP